MPVTVEEKYEYCFKGTESNKEIYGSGREVGEKCTVDWKKYGIGFMVVTKSFVVPWNLDIGVGSYQPATISWVQRNHKEKR